MITANPSAVASPTSFSQLMASFDQLRHLLVIRVSQPSLEALLSQNELGRRVHSHFPAVRHLAELPDEILHDTPDGEAARRLHGVVPVLRQDASEHAESPRMVMGFAVALGTDALVMFIHDTAADANVYVPGDHLPRVAFSELCLGLFVKQRTLQTAHFNEFKRMIRNELEGQRLFEAARRFNVQLWVGEQQVDLTSSSGRFRANFEGNEAAAERDTTRRRTTGGVLNALHSGGNGSPPAWPYAVNLMQLGYGPILNEDGEPLTRSGSGRKWKLIAPSPMEVEAVREMLRLVAEGYLWHQCAAPLADAQVAVRGQGPKGRTYDQLDNVSRAASVRSLVEDPDSMRLWQTGRYVRRIEVPVAHDGTFEGYPVTPDHGTYGFVDVDVDFGLPDGGFLDAETAEKIERRVAERERKDGDRTLCCALFAYLRPYRDTLGPDFTWERWLRRLGDYYVVRERPASEAVGARGKARGWGSGDGHQLLTVRRTELEKSVAESVRAAVVEVAAERLSVQVRDPGPSDRGNVLMTRIRELECRVEEERAAGVTADRIAEVAASAATFDVAAVARHTAAASAHYAAADRLTATVDEARAELEQVRADVPEHRFADLSTPAALAGCLVGYAGHDVPLEVNQALRTVGLNSLRLEVDPANPARVNWTLTLDLPLTGGGIASIPVSGTIRNRRRDQAVPTTPYQVDAAITEGFLREGSPLHALQVSFGKTRAGVVTSMRNHLSRHGVVSRGLRAAIVDLPVEMAETRLALWSVVSGDLASAAHLAPLRAHLGRVYTGKRSHPNAWVRTDTTLVRTALRVLVDAANAGGTSGIGIEVLARAIGASTTDVSRLCGDRSGSGATGARFRGILVRDQLNPSIVRLRECPHPDCNAAKGSRWLSHYLPVPETDGYHGLICPSCHRLPDADLAHLYLPAGYLDHLWNGPEDAANFDLKEAPATQEADPDRYRPSSRLPRHHRVYNIPEAATELGITDAALRGWIRDPEDPLPNERLFGQGGLKYAITEATLEEARAHPRLAELCKNSPRPTGLDGDFITLSELSHRTNVSEHYLRARAIAGDLGPVERRNLTGKGQAHLVVSRTVLHPDDPDLGTPRLPADWLERHRRDLLLIGEVVKRTGLTAPVIRAEVKAGRLRSLITDGGTHRFDVADVVAFAERRRRSCLTPQAAGTRAGVHPDVLRRAHRRGELPADLTPGGHTRYAVDDLDAWSASRRPDLS